MAFDTEKYIIDLVRQLNLNNMDDATRARLDDLQKKGVATKKQNGWDPAKEPPEINAQEGTPPVYVYDYDDAHPDDNLKDLYLKLVVIMRDVAADKELKDNDKVKKFLDAFYGAGKAVEEFQAKSIPTTYNAIAIADYIDTNLPDLKLALDIKETDLAKLSTALRSGTYTTNAKALNVFTTLLQKLYSFHNNSTNPLPGIPPVEVDDLSAISAIYQEITTPVSPSSVQTTQLKNGLNDLFGKLVTDDKLRDKVLGKDTDGDITKWLNKGFEKSNYKDGDDALTPKHSDRKRFWDDAKSKINDWYVDTLGKLEQKHKRHIYQTNARYIVEQLLKKKVQPTDGTAKILETFDAINGDLPNPVQSQLKWIKETFSKMKDTKFFKEALEDGDQMRALVQEIIKAAAHDDKIKEAKVALEMLAVMRYTLFTSGVRDKLRKTELTIFGDSKLSFNKGAMGTVTKAVDKVIHTGMMAAFEVGNLAKNAIQQHGVKFKQGEARLDKRTTGSVEYADPDKKQKMEELFAFWDFVNSSANTKDYNIFRSHKDLQKAQDKPGYAGTYTVTTAGGATYSQDDPTRQQKRFLDYLAEQNIGRVA